MPLDLNVLTLVFAVLVTSGIFVKKDPPVQYLVLAVSEMHCNAVTWHYLVFDPGHLVFPDFNLLGMSTQFYHVCLSICLSFQCTAMSNGTKHNVHMHAEKVP